MEAGALQHVEFTAAQLGQIQVPSGGLGDIIRRLSR